MTSIDVSLARFDASKEKVRREIRDGFFNGDGTLRITERELRLWLADRAVDELKVVFQLTTLLSRGAHLIPPRILVQITEQASDEARHFDILRGLVPADAQSVIDAKVAALPAALATDEHWVSLLVAVDAGNPFSALLDINIVHEGYSAAAIEELADVPFEDVRRAYAAIGADEEKHHESGRELLLWLTGAAGDPASARVIARAHERAESGSAMSWSWP
jgi:hypothetical protein